MDTFGPQQNVCRCLDGLLSIEKDDIVKDARVLNERRVQFQRELRQYIATLIKAYSFVCGTPPLDIDLLGENAPRSHQGPETEKEWICSVFGELEVYGWTYVFENNDRVEYSLDSPYGMHTSVKRVWLTARVDILIAASLNF